MTTGIISAAGRPPSPDLPMLYIQTDAAINPGNSGGPLLNVEGDLVGTNTSVINDSGRNQGLGFAVAAAVVRYAYEQLRARGDVRYSLMISDVLPGSPRKPLDCRRAT
jgi:serine protease Do